MVLLFSVVLPRYVAGGAETGGALVFRDARVFDGVQVLPRATVLVWHGRIAAVGAQLQVTEGARVIDARGKTLLPGLIDSHTHVFGPEVLRLPWSSASRLSLPRPVSLLTSDPFQ